MGGGSHLGGRGLGLVCKIPNELWEECRGTEASKARTHPSPHGALSLTELTLVRAHEKHIDHLFHSAVQKGWVRPRLWPCLAVHCSALGAQGGRRARLGVTNAARSGRGGSPTPADCRDCRPACCGRVSRACAWAEGSVVLFPVASAHLRTGGGKMGEKPPPPQSPNTSLISALWGISLAHMYCLPPPPRTHTHTHKLRTSLSWERLLVKHCRRRHGRDAAGQKRRLCAEGQLPRSRFQNARFPWGWGQAMQTVHVSNPKRCVHPAVPTGTPMPRPSMRNRAWAHGCARFPTLSVCVCVCVCVRARTPRYPFHLMLKLRGSTPTILPSLQTISSMFRPPLRLGWTHLANGKDSCPPLCGPDAKQ